jgi:hypothetical protein
MVSIEFEFDTQYGTFRDALVLPDDHGLSDAELDVMKQQHLDNWIAFILNPPVDTPTE